MSSPSNPVILELGSVHFAYDRGRPLIDDLSFTVRQGDFIGLLGANGSGKSTILKLGSRLLKPSSGGVKLWGKDIQAVRNRDRAKLISYLPQSLDINVPFTIRELVSMGLYPYDIPPVMSVDDALAMVGLAAKSNAYLSDLSGGERRRTFIAMTLLQGAGLLLLDEPLANLDIKYQIELVRLLRKLNKERNISVVMALHDINIALQFEKVMLIKSGKIIGAGRPEEILTREKVEQAFDVPVSIRRSESGSLYVSYEDHL
jgi:ABC-type cobalamin/Fe3+-siderophores transport system ATPase subunit